MMSEAHFAFSGWFAHPLLFTARRFSLEETVDWIYGVVCIAYLIPRASST